MWVYAHERRCLWRPQEGARSPGARVLVSHLIIGYWKWNLGSLQEQYMLLTAKLSLQLLFLFVCLYGSYIEIRGHPGLLVPFSIMLAASHFEGPTFSLLFSDKVSLTKYSSLALDVQSSCFSLPRN